MNKKNVPFLFLTLFCAASVFAGGKSDKSTTPSAANAPAPTAITTGQATLDKDSSYAFGVLLGRDIQEFGILLDYTAFFDGFKSSAENKSTRLTMAESLELAQVALANAVSRQAEENSAAGKKFLADNGKRAGVKTTASGLQYEVIREGSGAKPAADSVVVCNYEGTLIDGTVFDSTKDSGRSATIDIAHVIPGFSEGLRLMSVGSKYKLYIPSELAYGEGSRETGLPPNSLLIFEVELLEVHDAGDGSF